jgi:nicotinamidase-related amidase
LRRSLDSRECPTVAKDKGPRRRGPSLQLKHNIVGLTKAALALKVPVIVTTTTEKMWGPLIPELQDALPGVQRIERTTVNAWDDPRVVAAIKATGRKKIIITGISTDVCLAFPAISAVAEGYSAYAVVDELNPDYLKLAITSVRARPATA